LIKLLDLYGLVVVVMYPGELLQAPGSLLFNKH